MTNPQLQIEVRGDLIIITHPATQFFAIYVKPNNRSELVLKRRTDTGDNVLLVQVWQAANDKARELGWIGKATGLARLSPISFWSCCYILAFADQCVGVLLA